MRIKDLRREDGYDGNNYHVAIWKHYDYTGKLTKVMKEARWQEPQVGQLPFERGYNLAMTQVQRALTGGRD